MAKTSYLGYNRCFLILYRFFEIFLSSSERLFDMKNELCFSANVFFVLFFILSRPSSSTFILSFSLLPLLILRKQCTFVPVYINEESVHNLFYKTLLRYMTEFMEKCIFFIVLAKKMI